MMQILYYGKGDFKIKSKTAQIKLGEICEINDFKLSEPGEYDVAGIRVESNNDITFFNIDGNSLAYLGKRKNPLTNEEINDLENVDVLMVPVGGGDVLSPKEAMEIIKNLEPKIVIPMYYQDISEFSKLDGVVPEVLDELKIKNELTEEAIRRIIVLNEKSK